MKWLIGALGALILLVAAAVAVPFLLPLEDYIPRIEKAVSDRLNEPVKIRKIRLVAFPLPHAVIDGITARANTSRLARSP